MKNIQYILLRHQRVIATIIVLLLLASPALTGTSLAQIEEVRRGIGATGDGPDGVTAESAVASGINIFSFIVGIISVVMIVIGGLKYITSTGDSGKVDSAKNTILYAVIGLVIVALAQIIVRFVLDRVAPEPTP